MNFSNGQLIHIGVETVIIGGVTYFLNSKIDKNTQVITLLAQEIDSLKQVLQHQAHYIRELVKETGISIHNYDIEDGGVDGEDIEEPLPPSPKCSTKKCKLPPPSQNSSQKSPQTPPQNNEPPAPKGLKPRRIPKVIKAFQEEELLEELEEELEEMNKVKEETEEVCKEEETGEKIEEIDEEPPVMTEYPATLDKIDLGKDSLPSKNPLRRR